MDNKQVNPNPDDQWLDEILGISQMPQELGADELAVQAAGLTHPDDLELEQILSENWDSVAPDEEPEPSVPSAEEPATEETAQPSADDTQFYTPVSEETQVIPAQPEPEKPKKEKKQKAAPEQDPTVRKVRPEKKKGYGLWGIPHILSTLIWLLVIALVGATLGHTLWVSCADLMAFGKPDKQVTVTITTQDTIETIAQKLYDADLIEYPTLFRLFATLTGKDEDIDIGTFTLNSKYDYNAMINNMINYGPSREVIDIMIPEGYTCAQIFALMEEKGVCTAAELEEYAANGELSEYWFLEGVERGDKYCLEGYLFPDTYQFYTHDEPRNVLEKFLDGFDYRFTDVMKNKLETIQSRTGLDLSIRDVVIIASMVEKETASNAESYEISKVIYNRLKNPGSFPYLNIDATLIYALGGNVDPETGLSKPLTKQDMLMDHPYNTYNNQGLPPGPISNPGRNSLDAALDPQSDYTYYYYVYNPHSGKHMFARTLEEHEENIRYINSLG